MTRHLLHVWHLPGISSLVSHKSWVPEVLPMLYKRCLGKLTWTPRLEIQAKFYLQNDYCVCSFPFHQAEARVIYEATDKSEALSGIIWRLVKCEIMKIWIMWDWGAAWWVNSSYCIYGEPFSFLRFFFIRKGNSLVIVTARHKL